MHATQASAHTPRRWTRAEFDRLVEHGLLREDERVELIDGEILTMAPQQYSPHAALVTHFQEALRTAFAPGFHLRVQMPFALDPMSEPAPDLAVVAGAPLDYFEGHPEHTVLIVEVADTTLRFDRRRKGSLYARAGVPEYWILDVNRRALEVHQDPTEEPGARYGWAYRTVTRLRAGDAVIPLGAPGIEIAVADLLPPA
jgi:Uma2 family endonuclease